MFVKQKRWRERGKETERELETSTGKTTVILNNCRPHSPGRFIVVRYKMWPGASVIAEEVFFVDAEGVLDKYRMN